jgi:hypothetical protein
MMRIMLSVVAVLEVGCAHAALRSPLLEPMKATEPAEPIADQFRRDQAAGISEEGLRAILSAPVTLDETQRVGVLAVTDSYRPERGLPLPAVPAELTHSLEGAGLFQATSEVSTDWPADAGLGGLRELAARYRCGYLLLYRQRFLDDSWLNGWAWLYFTLIGAAVAPSVTLETAGVLEATLFDVRTGTILFTIYERVRARSDDTPWGEERKLRAMKLRLLDQAAGKLAEQVVSKVRSLVGARRSAGASAPVSSTTRVEPGRGAGPPAADRPAVPVVLGAVSAPQRRLFIREDEQMERDGHEGGIGE